MTAPDWYSALAAAVSGKGTLALITPAIAMPVQATDDQLWALFNTIPPPIRNNTLSMSGGNQFYSDYAGMLSQLTSTALTNFQSVAGVYYPLWQRYLGGLNPLPTPAALPNVFYTWATANAPSVANAGRAAYVVALNDPIFAAQTAAANTSLFVSNTPNFRKGVAQLFSEDIAARGPITLRVRSAAATFRKLFTFTNTPATWYSPGVMQQAYAASAGGVPWVQGASPDWQRTFGTTGNLQRFITSVVVADGIQSAGIAGAVPAPAGQPVIIGAFVASAAQFAAPA